MGFASPIPPLAIVVGTVHRELQQLFEPIGQFVVGVHVREERSGPRARNVVGQEVIRHIGPSDRVVFGYARPRDAVQLARLDRDLYILPRKRYRNDSELAQKPACGREGENPLSLEILKAADRLFRREMARIPCSCGQPFDADLRILRVPDLAEPVLVEQHRHIQGVAAGEREISAEHGDLRRRRHRIVVRLNGVDRAALHSAKKLPRGDQLIGEEQLDLHFVSGDLVERLHGGLDDMFRQSRSGIGLHAPADLRLGMHGGRSERGRSAQSRRGDEIASRRHMISPFVCVRRNAELRPSRHYA